MWLLWLLQEFQLEKLQEQLNIQNNFIPSCVDTENNNKKKIQKQIKSVSFPTKPPFQYFRKTLFFSFFFLK